MTKVGAIRLVLLVVLALVVGIQSHFVQSSPSGQNWAIEGGGFCQSTYVAYNNTVDKLLYAENCQTGTNDCIAQTDLGALWNNCVRANMPNGGIFGIRAGYYSVVTSIVLTPNSCPGFANGICDLGLIWQGSGSGHTNGLTDPAHTNGTILVAKTSGMTMLKSSTNPVISTGVIVQRVQIRDIAFQGNGLANTAIDFRMTETATLNRFNNLFITNLGGSAAPFTTAIYLDGNEDTTLQDCVFDGAGSSATRGANVDLQWIDTFGNPLIVGTFFGGQTIIVGSNDNVMIRDSTLQAIQIGSSGGLITLDGGYINGLNNVGQNGGKIVNVGAFSASFQMNGGFYDNLVQGGLSVPFFGGSGVILSFGVSHSLWQFGPAANWLTGTVTVTKSVTTGDNHVRGSGSTPTGFPFTVDGNANF